MELNTETSKLLSESLDRAILPKFPYFNTLLRIMVTRCLTQAAYFPAGECSYKDYLHYGLAAPIYTHFTSPIRRYSDIMAHRLLSCSIGIESMLDIYQDTKYLHDLCSVNPMY